MTTTLQPFLDLRSGCVSKWPTQLGLRESRKVLTHVFNCRSTQGSLHKAVYTRQSTWNTNSDTPEHDRPATWLPCRLCYRPAIFFCHPRSTALSFLREKLLQALHKFYYFQKCFILYLKLRNFKLSMSGCACVRAWGLTL